MALNYVTLGGHHAGRAEEHGYANRHAAMSCQKGVRLFLLCPCIYFHVCPENNLENSFLNTKPKTRFNA